MMIRCMIMPNLGAENSEKFIDYVVETKIYDRLNILDSIGPMFINDYTYGIVTRMDSSLVPLRDLIGQSEVSLTASAKIRIMANILDAVAHLSERLDVEDQDFEISPDTVMVNVAKEEASLEILGRMGFDSFNKFERNPEFVAPEYLATGVLKKELLNFHTYSIGALFYYMVFEKERFCGMEPADIALEVILFRFLLFQNAGR